MTAEINLFHNWTSDYIYQQHSSNLLFNQAVGSFVTPVAACDECSPVLDSQQTNAGENETQTKGYMLLNVGAQYRLADIHDAEILLFAKDKNLLNENIRNSTSYLRNFAPKPGRSAELGIRITY